MKGREFDLKYIMSTMPYVRLRALYRASHDGNDAGFYLLNRKRRCNYCEPRRPMKKLLFTVKVLHEPSYRHKRPTKTHNYPCFECFIQYILKMINHLEENGGIDEGYNLHDIDKIPDQTRRDIIYNMRKLPIDIRAKFTEHLLITTIRR